MKVRFGLTGKTAVITGAGGVICSVMALELARQGVKVALLDIVEENAKSAAQVIRAEGYEAIAVAADVLDPKSLSRARDTVMNSFGTLDILINGAGGNKKAGDYQCRDRFFRTRPGRNSVGVRPERNRCDSHHTGVWA